jgi:hypothetical protein
MFSKFLVWANLVLSLVFLGWAIGLYTQRLDWAPHKELITGKVDEKSGRLYAMHEEIEELVKNRDLAEQRWQKDAHDLPALEGKRLEHKQFYEDQLLLAQHGKDSKSQTPKDRPVVAELVPDPDAPAQGLPDGTYVIDPKKLKPIKSRDQDVKSIAEYDELYRKLRKEIDDLQVEIDKLVEENTRLTKLIAGDPGKTMGERAKLDAKLNYKKLFDDEMLILRPLLVTQRINIEQQKQRLAALEARLKELQVLLPK